MKLCAVLLLVLPLACVSFSPTRRPKVTTVELSSDTQPLLKDEELTINNTEITPQQGQPKPKDRPVVILFKGRRKKKNRRPKKVLCRKGSKSRKCRRWARKQARRQRRINRRLAAAAKRIHYGPNKKVTPVNPPLADLCRRFNRRGIEDTALRCAETNNIDVDTFMDFVLLVLSNSSINGQDELYPEDEQEQIENILSCLGQRKRWHRTNDLDEVLAELRIKNSFSSIEPCVKNVGRNCSWTEEQASGWFNCVDLKCKQLNSQYQNTRFRSGKPQPVTQATEEPVLSTAEPSEEDDDLNSILTEDLPFEKIEDYNVGPKEDPEEDYEYEYVDDVKPDITPFLEEDRDYEGEEEEEDYQQWMEINQ